jgi:hypothetical protein
MEIHSISGFILINVLSEFYLLNIPKVLFILNRFSFKEHKALLNISLIYDIIKLKYRNKHFIINIKHFAIDVFGITPKYSRISYISMNSKFNKIKYSSIKYSQIRLISE